MPCHSRRLSIVGHPPHPDAQQWGNKAMWDTVETNTGSGSVHLSHDLPCSDCGHAGHTYLPCSDTCDCAHGRDRRLSAV